VCDELYGLSKEREGRKREREKERDINKSQLAFYKKGLYVIFCAFLFLSFLCYLPSSLFFWLHAICHFCCTKMLFMPSVSQNTFLCK
jgi:uncharacterized membrane protein